MNDFKDYNKRLGKNKNHFTSADHFDTVETSKNYINDLRK